MYALGFTDMRFLLTNLSPAERKNVREEARRQRRRRFPLPSLD